MRCDSYGADDEMLKHFGGAYPYEARRIPPVEAPTWFFSTLVCPSFGYKGGGDGVGRPFGLWSRKTG